MNHAADNVLKNEYVSRLNRAVDFIHSHSHEDLNLARLAEVACFSKYHFHRIFRAVLGETVNEFVGRIRLEKALDQLILHRFKSITEIALDSGFSSSQNFARSFKTRYGITPSDARKEYSWGSWLEKMEKIKDQDIRDLQPDEMALANRYIHQRKLSLERILNSPPEMQVIVKKLPTYHVAYVRTWGPYDVEKGVSAVARLLQWAAPKGLIHDESIVIGVVWNNPEITPPEKWIYDVCIPVPESILPDRWVNIQDLKGGDFAVHHCEIEIHRQEEEWMRFYLNWLAKSEYQPDDRPLYSIYYNIEDSPTAQRVVKDFCLPVKPLMV